MRHGLGSAIERLSLPLGFRDFAQGRGCRGAITTICVWLLAAPSFAAGLQLAAAGKTSYQIVLAADAPDVDRYAAETLAGYLRQITSAEFPLVASGAMNEDRPALFVGLSEPALRRLGGDPLARLEDQEHVSRSKGRDIWESRQPSKGKEGARIRLERKDIVAGKYRLYRLGTITITPDSWVWFSARSWATHQQLGERLHEPGTPNLWEAWVSLKFDGPTYGGTAAEDQVLCDRIIVVKQF